MKKLFKNFAVAAAATALFSATAVMAEDKEPIKFTAAQDFTAVYTFVSSGYSQGQRDYITLINERGGIDGHKVELSVTDTGNEPQRGIEAYNRAKRDGTVLVDFFSTPVANAMVDRVLEDEIPMIMVLHGRGDASDGNTFPYLFPLSATYWSQAARLIDYINENEGSLEGKKVALVHIDSPFGREPTPILEGLAENLGFEFRGFPYASPGNEQSATWSEVRRFRPDHIIIWGAGGSQPVSIRDALRNGFQPEQIYSVVWLAEADMDIVGPDIAKGVRKFQLAESGRENPIIQAIVDEVYGAGKGAGEIEEVGLTYYNVGVASMAMALEAARLAVEEYGAPLTGEKLRKGFELLDGFDAEGLIPKVTITNDDHQGGGAGRVVEWSGTAWEPISDWKASFQDLVWEQIEKGAKNYRESN